LNRTLLAIGFRPFYLLASVFAVAAILFWLAGFNGRLPVGAYLQGVFWHSHEMLFGYIVAVMAGFLFTAVRNWTGLPTPSGVTLGGIVLLWILARVLLVSGPSALAVILDVAFLPMIAIAVAIPILRSRNKRNYKIIVTIALRVSYGARWATAVLVIACVAVRIHRPRCHSVCPGRRASHSCFHT
jgi:uncharacterized protein involved in response to NO